jgi:YebC/PmpR family DNA-binding regulatory protein
MAGHSKWANIQHRKGAQDKRRAALFAKLSKEITISSKEGGADPGMNPRLRLAIANAKAVSMPKDNIQRAIDKGQGGGGADYFGVRYEGFGPGGAGIIVECSTDNRNRAASDVRVAFGKNGGNMGEANSVAFGFANLGEIVLPREAGSDDDVMMAALDAGAQDVESDEDGHYIYTAREDFMEVAGAIATAFPGVEARSTSLMWKPSTRVTLNAEQAETFIGLIEALEDLDDVQNVYHAADIPQDVLEKLGG